jgi:sulfur-oxidizing protein SoxZ
MADPTKIRANIKDGEGDLRILLAHPMESGQRRDTGGALLPAHFIQTLAIAVNGKLVIEGSLGPGVSKNPLFAFRLTDVKAGDKVTVSWVDNLGDRRTDEALFA